jgi:hypothetical protein
MWQSHSYVGSETKASARSILPIKLVLETHIGKWPAENLLSYSGGEKTSVIDCKGERSEGFSTQNR